MKTVLFLCTLQFTVTITGEPRLMCPTQQVRAKEGENATLPCHLDQRIDLSEDTVDWKRLDSKKFVHIYRDGQDKPDSQSPQYKDRTTLNHEGLKTGNLTLHISSVNQSDNGTYRCLIPKMAKSCTVDLLIEARSQLDETNTTTSASAEGGRNHWAAVIAVIISIAVVLLLHFLLILVLLTSSVG